MARTRIGRVVRELVDDEGRRWAVVQPLDRPRRVDPLREEYEADALVASISSDDELREWRSARLRWAMACAARKRARKRLRGQMVQPEAASR